MIWLLLFLLILLIVTSYLLLAPIYLEIDSTKSLVRVRFHRLASARLLNKNSSLIIEIKLAGLKKEFDLLEVRPKNNSPKQKKKVRSRKISLRKMNAIIRSFRLTKCYINIDFGEVEWNGILFPLFYWMSRMTGKNISINFYGKQVVQLQIKNNFARMILAYIHK